MSTIEAKYNRKRAESQIKILSYSKAAPASSNNDTSARETHKKKARTSILPDYNHQSKRTPKHSGVHCYYIMCKKSGTTDHKWKSHSPKNFFGKRFVQEYIKDLLGGTLGNRAAAVKQ